MCKFLTVIFFNIGLWPNCIFLISYFAWLLYTIYRCFQKKSLMLAFHVTCNHCLQPKFFRHHLCFPFIYTYCSTVCIQLSRYFSIFLLSEQQTNLFAHFDPECQDHRKVIKVLFCLGLQNIVHIASFWHKCWKVHNIRCRK